MPGHITEDPNDPELTRGVDNEPRPQAEKYLVLPKASDPDYVRPVRRKYVHSLCGCVTTMGTALAETYARDPKFYGATYCVNCRMHRPVTEFTWDGTNEIVGS